MTPIEKFEQWGRDREDDLLQNAWIIPVVCIIAALFLLTMFLVAVHAQEIDVEKLATAIYYAEGGARTNYPYGILTKYKTTTPRQACINTINHALKDWDGRGDFISFLGSRYCPVGAANDPRGLNRNWISNVRRIYERNA
jgi:hypothetical protein